MAIATSTLVGAGIAAAVSVGTNAINNEVNKSGKTKVRPDGLITPTTADDVTAANQQNQNAMTQQQNLVNALQAQGGIQNQSDVYGQQQGLAAQLQGMVNGQGPSVAQNSLNQATGANVANQAALMAGQRGAGANAGLMARQIAQQGAATQQQAAGQAATLRAQEQLGAVSALQAQQNMLGNLSTQQVGQQMGSIGTLNNQTANNQGQMLTAANNQNAILSGNQNAANTNATTLANTQNQFTNSLVKGAVSGAGAAGTVLSGPDAKIPAPDAGTTGSPEPVDIKYSGGAVNAYKGKSYVGLHLYHGGKVPVMLSPGEIKLTPAEAQAVAQGRMNPMHGDRVGGKAVVKGDSPKNDIVRDEVAPGTVIVKRTKAKDAESAAEFVKAVQKKKGKK